MERQELLRSIPGVDTVCASPCFAGMEGSALARAAREVLDAQRVGILAGTIGTPPSFEGLCDRVLARCREDARPSLRPVINGTGVILHTNLGRASLSKRAVEAVCSVAARYSTLEYTPETGERGSRHSHVEELLCRITGAEAAMVVNNNAAAVLLALSGLANGREVVISRGELVEIGGSFRIPEVMEQSGAVLREVGATNKTHPEDYERAIGPSTATLFKVHTSNYRIVGFSQEVPLSELVGIGERHGLPVLHDLGSGLLFPPEMLGLQGEPYAGESIRAGASLVLFSGDKLLGGPQAGILAGKEKWIGRLKKHPLARALRVDKLCLAALEATLRASLDPALARAEIPVLNRLCADRKELLGRAESLRAAIGELRGCRVEIVEDCGQVGGGAVPMQRLPSYAVSLSPEALSLVDLDRRLNRRETPIVGHVHKQCCLLNVLTLSESEFQEIAGALKDIFA